MTWWKNKKKQIIPTRRNATVPQQFRLISPPTDEESQNHTAENCCVPVNLPWTRSAPFFDKKESKMSRSTRTLTGALAISASLALLSGCGSSPEENSAELCSAAASFKSALNDFQEVISPEATTEEVRSRWDALQAAYQDLEAEGADVAQDRMDGLETAAGQLRSAVADVPDEATLRQGIDSLRNEASDVRSAFSELEGELTC